MLAAAATHIELAPRQRYFDTMSERIANLLLYDTHRKRASLTRLALALSPLLGTIAVAVVAILS